MVLFSGASLYNLYDEDDEESSVTVPQETIQENNVTMNKMKLLRSKMQSLHMSKKVGYDTALLKITYQVTS
jgi:AN1-type zinc finger and ubiquitin domain-containing protein 1